MLDGCYDVLESVVACIVLYTSLVIGVCFLCVTAHALPMFREARQRSTRKQLEKDRLDPLKSHKPEPPVSGPGDVPVSVSYTFC